MGGASGGDTRGSAGAGTAALGWTPVREVPPFFRAGVAAAEAATMRWTLHRDPAALDEWVARWDAICGDPRFAGADLTFRLDALNRCGVAHFECDRLRWPDEADLERAEACWRAALALAPDGWADRARYLSNLGSASLRRYSRGGEPAHLSHAIEVLEQAVRTTSATESASNRALYHQNLGTALADRYDRQGTLDDLDDAIAHGRIALELTPARSHHRALYLSVLGSRYRERFLRSRSEEDIERAIGLLAAGVEEAEQGATSEAFLPIGLTNLGNALLNRYDAAGEPEDLERAVAAQRRAVDLTPDGDPLLASRLNNLANSLSGLSRLNDTPADLDAAIVAYRRAITLTPATDPLLSSRLYNLANSVSERLQWGSGPADLDEAVRRYREACTSGLDYSLEWALGAASAWGAWAEERGAWEEAGEAYGYGLVATERLYRAQLLEAQKQSWLVQARDLARRASYVQARLGQASQAVVILEQNRARALSEALQYQGAAVESVSAADRDALRRIRGRIADLAARARAAEESSARDFLAASEALRVASDEQAALAARIRSYAPEFAPEGLAFADIVALATEAGQPFVYLLTGRHGSLALIVPPAAPSQAPDATGVEPLWLHPFTAERLEDILFDRDEGSGEAEGGEGADPRRYLNGTVLGDLDLLRRVLDDIWPVLVQQLMGPVAQRLVELGFRRAVLIPTGTLTLLPLAGAAPDGVTFSLAPSARALRSMLRDTDHVRLPPRLLGVGDPVSTGLPPLAFARPEVEQIAAVFAARGLETTAFFGREATLGEVTRHVPGATHLHFACHGRFWLPDPLSSALCLAGEDTLVLRALLAGGLDVAAARLAVLSACQTAITDFRDVPDEVVGFPAGFIRAGVPGVISTLWPVNDLSTAALLARFYRHLVEGDDPATALRRAQLWLRDASAGELALVSRLEEHFRASNRRDKAAFSAIVYYRTHPAETPFAHPFFWAGFVFSGA